tara:strand:+ start:2803 stop:3129 length:327 start_codon:yes stop_codon:yes gene_type:complete
MKSRTYSILRFAAIVFVMIFFNCFALASITDVEPETKPETDEEQKDEGSKENFEKYGADYHASIVENKKKIAELRKTRCMNEDLIRMRKQQTKLNEEITQLNHIEDKT